jgi:hypothetical protein
MKRAYLLSCASLLLVSLVVAHAAAMSGVGSFTTEQATAKRSTGYSVPRLLRKVLLRVKSRSQVPILLPSRIPAPSHRPKVYPEGKGRSGSYELYLGFAPRCGPSTVCYYAEFFGNRGRGFERDTRGVRLAGGIPGRFRPQSCGASCAPPLVQWKSKGIRYSILLKEASATPTAESEEKVMVHLANSAIRAGPR